jgi:hypothetical protein
MLRRSILAAAALALFAAAGAVQAQSPQSYGAAPPTAQYMTVQVPIQYAAPPVQYAAPPVTYAAAPVAYAAAPHQITWGPTPVGLMLAHVGRKMATLDQRHVWTFQHARYAQVPAPAAYSLVAAPQAFTYAIPQQYAIQPPAAPPVAYSTPQTAAFSYQSAFGTPAPQHPLAALFTSAQPMVLVPVPTPAPQPQPQPGPAPPSPVVNPFPPLDDKAPTPPAKP